MGMNVRDGLGKTLGQATSAVKGMAGEVGKVVRDNVADVGNAVVETGESAADFVQGTVGKITDVASNFSVEDAIYAAMKLPGVYVERESFLRKELKGRYSEETINCAIAHNPAYAGIERGEVDVIANRVVDFETNQVSLISFAAGLPGGIIAAGAIPADTAQYFGALLRTMQKLAYLYGFDDFKIDGERVNEEQMNEIMLFLGVMFGVQGAAKVVQALAGSVAAKVGKDMTRKALTKGVVYPIVKQVAKMVGARMTKEIFAKGVSKAVPVVGGVVSGGLTYATFRPCVDKLRWSLRGLELSNPDFYARMVEPSALNRAC